MPAGAARRNFSEGMTSILIAWVNDELQLDPLLTETTLAQELSSGFILGALLHRHNQLPEHHKLRRRDTADSKIQNFCLLEPALCKLGVKFDANVAHGIMRATSGSAAMVLYQLKIALDKLVKFATPVSLHASRDGVQPLPNLPVRPGKPQFDGARARRPSLGSGSPPPGLHRLPTAVDARHSCGRDPSGRRRLCAPER